MTDHQAETDSRFFSGPWTGHFWQSRRFWMDLHLEFSEGQLGGAGCDFVGEFMMRGTYDVQSGEVLIHKHYVGEHHVFYRGKSDGKAIAGQWSLGDFSGPFLIWPVGAGDPTARRFRVEAEVPIDDLVTSN